MPLPGGATGFTLTGGPYDDPAFQGMAGVLTMSTPVTHVATGERIRKTWNFSVDYSGQFSVGPLPFTDDPAFTPTGFTYTITWQALSYKDTPGNLTFQVPTAAGTTIDFDTLFPAVNGQTVPLGVYSVNGHQGAVTLAKADVGLGSVDNTADTAKPVSTAQAAALAAKANIADIPTAGTATGDALRAAFGPPVGQRMTLMGDSRVTLCTPPGGTTSNGSTYTKDDRSWWEWAQIALGHRFDYVANTAVGSTTTAQHISGQLATVLASGATHVIHFGFLNDMAGSTPDPTVTIANLTTIYNAIRGAGKKLIATIDYLQPAQTNPAQIAANAKINAFIRSYARANTSVTLWDVAALLVDPDTGYIRASYAIDGTHPNKKGSMILGQSLAQILGPTTTPLSPLTATPNDPYNLILNGQLLGASPTGWASSNGAGGAVPGTVTRVTRTDGGPGYLWQAQLAATGSDTGKVVMFSATTDVSGLAGHVIVPRFYFETGVQGGAMDWSNIDHFYAHADISGTATGSSFTLFPGSDSAAVPAVNFPRSGIMQGPKITVGAGATTVRMFFELATTAAGAGGGTVRIGQAEIHDLTACGY